MILIGSAVDDLSPLLTSPEVGDLLRISQATLSRWRAADLGPRWLDLHGVPRYAPDDVRMWLQLQTRAEST
jgi:hypothetical protein